MKRLPAAVLSLGIGAGAAGSFYGLGYLVSSPEVPIAQNCAKQLGSTALDASKWIDNCKYYTPTGIPALLQSDESTGNRTLTYTLPNAAVYLEEALPYAEQQDASRERVYDIGSGVMGGVSAAVVFGAISLVNRERSRIPSLSAQAAQ